MSQLFQMDPYDLLFDIIINEIDNGLATDNAIFHLMSEEVVKRILKARSTMIGSDGYALADYGKLSEQMCHPRSYGTFPKVLRKYVREQKVISIEEAVNKMTFLPATKFNLPKRGLIKKGFFADIVIFDLNTICDKATYEQPHQYPVGIDYSIVNGKVVVDKGTHTKVLSGRVLSKAL